MMDWQIHKYITTRLEKISKLKDSNMVYRFGEGKKSTALCHILVPFSIHKKYWTSVDTARNDNVN